MAKLNDYKPKLGNLDLFKCSDKELIQFGYQAINHHISDIIAPEMMRRLKISIKEFNKNSSRQSKIMINLTKWIIGLTISLSILAVIQIILLLK